MAEITLAYTIPAPPAGAEGATQYVLRLPPGQTPGEGYVCVHYRRGYYWWLPRRINDRRLVLWRARAARYAMDLGWPISWVGQCTYACYVPVDWQAPADWRI